MVQLLFQNKKLYNLVYKNLYFLFFKLNEKIKKYAKA